jgi:hypothetical protein
LIRQPRALNESGNRAAPLEEKYMRAKFIFEKALKLN